MACAASPASSRSWAWKVTSLPSKISTPTNSRVNHRMDDSWANSRPPASGLTACKRPSTLAWTALCWKPSHEPGLARHSPQARKHFTTDLDRPDYGLARRRVAEFVGSAQHRTQTETRSASRSIHPLCSHTEESGKGRAERASPGRHQQIWAGGYHD